MGIVTRESVKGSIASYFGLVIGTINILFLYTKFLSPDQLGLTRVIQDSTLLFVSFAQLGSPYIVIKFFPHFYDKTNKHNGFLFFILTYTLIGFLFFAILFISLQNFYLQFYLDKSPLLIKYFFYIVPFAFGMIYINLLESYILVHNKVFFPTFIREVLLKIGNTIAIVLFALHIVDFTNFMNLIVLTYFASVLILTIYVYKLKGLFIRPSFKILSSGKLKSIVGYGLYTILGGIGFILATKIDTIMLPAYQGLTQTAIYSIAVLIAAVMEIPKRNMVKAVVPILSFAIKNNETDKIDDIYKKTSINLAIFGLLIFLLIWANVDNLFKVIPNGNIYAGGKTVLFLFLFTRLLDLFSGVNNEIILYSKYYIYGLVLMLILAVLTIVTNMIFIPIYGILGAAIATTLSVMIYLIMKIFLVWKKFNLHPFKASSVKAVILFLIFLVLSFFIDQIFNNYFSNIIKIKNIQISALVQILIKTIVITFVFIFLFLKFKVSEEFNGLIFNILRRLRIF